MWGHKSLDWSGNFQYNPDVLPFEKIYSLERELSILLADLNVDIIGLTQLMVLEREILANSKIEGVSLPEEAVRSSLFRRLAIRIPDKSSFDRNAQDCMEVLVDAVTNHDDLTVPRLLSWQTKFVNNKYFSGRFRNTADGEMRVVSGPLGFEKVHYIAPDASRLESEITLFFHKLKKFSGESIVKAALAHLRFVLIHPFPDGNGRTARTISDYILAKENPVFAAFAGLSYAYLNNRKDYDRILDKCSTSMDASEWLDFTCKIRIETLQETLDLVPKIVAQHNFLHLAKNSGFSPEELSVLYKISRPDFLGKITPRKIALFLKTSSENSCLFLEKLEINGLAQRNGNSWELCLSEENSSPKP